jgi:hypothetical protein
VGAGGEAVVWFVRMGVRGMRRCSRHHCRRWLNRCISTWHRAPFVRIGIRTMRSDGEGFQGATVTTAAAAAERFERAITTAGMF